MATGGERINARGHLVRVRFRHHVSAVLGRESRFRVFDGREYEEARLH
jgi:hypothetical protein